MDLLLARLDHLPDGRVPQRVGHHPIDTYRQSLPQIIEQSEGSEVDWFFWTGPIVNL